MTNDVNPSGQAGVGDPYGTPPQYSAPDPGYSQPQYAQPQYSQPQYAQPQYSQPQYSQPQYAQPQYNQPQQPVPYGQPMAVAPKNPAISLIASFFIPGLGSMLNGEAGKGVGILVGYIVGVLLSFFFIGVPIALGMWIWGMIDGYQGAQKWNARFGIYS